MEIRVLQYFLAIAREQSIIRAAESLHLSQPTLSTQIKNMEEELGKQLLIRGTKGSRKVTLTEEGMILRKRAEEILDLVKKTENDIVCSDDVVIGDVYIGAGETDGMRLLAKSAGKLKKLYPGIHYHISSGNAIFVKEQLDKGLIDFGIIFGTPDRTKYKALLKGEVYKHGKPLDLTASEYKLLCLFMENPDHILSPKQILGKLWDCGENYIWSGRSMA